jgi:hypothetical protein
MRKRLKKTVRDVPAVSGDFDIAGDFTTRVGRARRAGFLRMSNARLGRIEALLVVLTAIPG